MDEKGMSDAGIGGWRDENAEVVVERRRDPLG